MNYIIKKGDNLYQLSRKYNVSVEDIIKYNPGINPHNLVIGSYIYIPKNNSDNGMHHLHERMRELWEQHVFWTRLLIVSIVDNLKDEPETTNRLLRNATELGLLYESYYGKQVGNIVAKLINEHFIIASELIHAIVSNDSMAVNALNTAWYRNADEIADALSSVNKHYNKEELRKMLYIHLNLTKEEVMNRVNHKYKREIEVFDNVEKEAIMMADYLAHGISKQFI